MSKKTSNPGSTRRMRRGNRPGLWVSACGRFTVRRLGSGAWIAGPIHSPAGGGPFSGWVGKQLLAQRFASKAEAAEALDVVLDMSCKRKKPVVLEWKKNSHGIWTACWQDHVVQSHRAGNLWRVIAMPETSYALMAQLDQTDSPSPISRFGLDHRIKSTVTYLGTSRTLREAQALSAEELAWSQED